MFEGMRAAEGINGHSKESNLFHVELFAVRLLFVRRVLGTWLFVTYTLGSNKNASFFLFAGLL